jgi:periplasmic divalent cation tolerance protein
MASCGVPDHFRRMKAARDFCIVLVTAPSAKVARKLAKDALCEKLVACVNIISKVESHYWWQGKLELGKEVLMVCKTTRSSVASLERFILANHPYDTPEFLVVQLAGGNARYLSWMAANVNG